MKRQRKEVRCLGHGPLQASRQASVPWEDVWLRFKVGREVQTWGPCLISAPDLDGDIEIHRELIREHPEHATEYGRDLAEMERTRDLLSANGIAVRPYGDQIPNVYTSAESIDRAEAERMLRVLMTTLGHPHVKFSWQKARVLAYPVSFGRRVA